MKGAIGRIPLGWSDHDIPKNFNTRRTTSDEKGLLSEIVTTKQYKNIHPNGLRYFSLREQACLQGFRLKHRFFRTGVNQKNIMTQIGNAFPTTVSAVFYEEIKQQLLIRDGLKPQGYTEEERKKVKTRPITAPEGMDETEGSAAGTGMRV